MFWLTNPFWTYLYANHQLSQGRKTGWTQISWKRQIVCDLSPVQSVFRLLEIKVSWFAKLLQDDLANQINWRLARSKRDLFK